jgi:hypothetical protein
VLGRHQLSQGSSTHSLTHSAYIVWFRAGGHLHGPDRLLGGGELFHGKFTWRIENFTKLKELLKKRKITGLCIKSRRFQVCFSRSP